MAQFLPHGGRYRSLLMWCMRASTGGRLAETRDCFVGTRVLGTSSRDRALRVHEHRRALLFIPPPSMPAALPEMAPLLYPHSMFVSSRFRDPSFALFSFPDRLRPSVVRLHLCLSVRLSGGSRCSFRAWCLSLPDSPPHPPQADDSRGVGALRPILQRHGRG